jgi:hypothetical protein
MTLTDEDRAALRTMGGIHTGALSDAHDKEIAEHFLAAGMERAAVICDREEDAPNGPINGKYFAQRIRRAAKDAP